MYPNWTWLHTSVVGGFAALVIFIAIVGWPVGAGSTLWLWALMAVAITVLAFFIGQGITGRPFGILIDQNYRMRLGVLQLVAWTVLIVSALLTAVLWNVAIKAAQPLHITIPVAVWGLLGISAASTAGTQLIHGQKAQRPASDADRIAHLARASLRASAPPPNADPTAQLAATTAAVNVEALKQQYRNRQIALRSVQLPTAADPVAAQAALQNTLANAAQSAAQLEENIKAASTALNVRTNGQLAANASVADASPAELFTGDDLGNDDTVDIGKVQMFLFTLALLVGYGASIASIFLSASNASAGSNEAAIMGFPNVDPGMLALLGVSQAGYPANTAAPHPAPDL